MVGKIIAEDLTGEDLSDVLELHRTHRHGGCCLEIRLWGRRAAPCRTRPRPRRAGDQDPLADDRRAKFEAIGQSRLVITNAVSVDKDHARIHAYPVSIIATDRALIYLAEPTRSSSRPGCPRSRKN